MRTAQGRPDGPAAGRLGRHRDGPRAARSPTSPASPTPSTRRPAAPDGTPGREGDVDPRLLATTRDRPRELRRRHPGAAAVGRAAAAELPADEHDTKSPGPTGSRSRPTARAARAAQPRRHAPRSSTSRAARSRYVDDRQLSLRRRDHARRQDRPGLATRRRAPCRSSTSRRARRSRTSSSAAPLAPRGDRDRPRAPTAPTSRSPTPTGSRDRPATRAVERTSRPRRPRGDGTAPVGAGADAATAAACSWPSRAPTS